MYASTPPALLTCRLFLFQCAYTIGAGWIGEPIGNADQARCANNFFSLVFSAITIGAGGISVPIVLADYKEDDCVPRALPIFIPIAY
jgi:hypothetical protein